MVKFEDQLLSDLMREHADTLATVAAPVAVRPGKRPVLIGAGALAAAAIAVGVVVWGGETPAHAVTRNPDGTITVRVQNFSEIDEANAEFRRQGVPVRAVAMTVDCMDSYQSGKGSYESVHAFTIDDRVVFRPERIPHGETIVIAARDRAPGDNGSGGISAVVQGRVPSCLRTQFPPPH